MKALIMNIEISDQYGTSKDHFVGVFDDSVSMDEVKAIINDRFQPNRRTYFEVVECELNKIIIPGKWR